MVKALPEVKVFELMEGSCLGPQSFSTSAELEKLKRDLRKWNLNLKIVRISEECMPGQIKGDRMRSTHNFDKSDKRGSDDKSEGKNGSDEPDIEPDSGLSVA